MTTSVWLNMDYVVTEYSDRFEAEAKLAWYSSVGRYNISCVGHGPTIDEAKKNASLMQGQARAALMVALIEPVSRRVPENTNEGANERSGEPVERAT